MNRKQPFSYEEFKSIYSRVPRLCVDLVILSEQGVVLTLRQKHGWEGMWHLPGGTVYYRERAEDAVRRVAKEELGIEVEIEKFFGYWEYLDEEKERGFGYSVSLVFICRTDTQKFELDGHAEKVEMFKDVPENTIEGQKLLLKKVLT